MRPPTLPDAEKFEHGTRSRYVTGCRCEPCTLANRNYARDRYLAKCKGDWNGIVLAVRARQHLKFLNKAGVGRRTVSDITGIAASVISAIRTGEKKRIRQRTEKKILEVTAEAGLNDATLLSSQEALKKIEELLEIGYTRMDLARRLGHKARCPSLQFKKGRRMTARNISKIDKLHRQLMDERRSDPSTWPVWFTHKEREDNT